MIAAKLRTWLLPAMQRLCRICRKFARCWAAKSGIRQLIAISQCNVFTPNSSRNLFASDLHGHGLAFAFATLREPGGQAFGKAFGSKTETCFHLAISHWERVVKVGSVDEVAHAKLIEPVEQAGAGFPANRDVDME